MLIFDHFFAILKFFGIYSLVTLNKGPLNTILHLEGGGSWLGVRQMYDWGWCNITPKQKKGEKREKKDKRGEVTEKTWI